MAMENEISVGLTEFVSQLIEETFDAVIMSAYEQVERDALLAQTASLTLEAYAADHVSDEKIDEVLLGLFPAEDGGHLIHVGTVYKPDAEMEPEIPALKSELGIELPEAGKLSARSVQLIRETVRERVARDEYGALQELIRRGVPRVVVERGRIAAKISFDTYEIKESNSPEAPDTTEPSQPIALAQPYFRTRSDALSSMIRRPIAAKDLSRIRMAVKPVKKEEDYSSKTHASTYGEIELQFKTTAG